MWLEANIASTVPGLPAVLKSTMLFNPASFDNQPLALCTWTLCEKCLSGPTSECMMCLYGYNCLITSTAGLCYFIIKQKARQTEWTNDTVMNLSRSNNGIDKQIQFCFCLWREEELEETQKKNKACLSARSTI